MTDTTPDILDALLDRVANRLADRVAELLEKRHAASVPANDVPTGLVDKRIVAGQLGVSLPTVDRMVAAGMPFARVNARKRFDVVACRAWAAARGRKPTTAPKRGSPAVTDAELDEIAEASGLRRR
jgi:hypothetical protein